MKKKKMERRGGGVKGKGVTNCWDFCGNFIILLGFFLGIWSFQNSKKSQLFLGIPRKELGISEVLSCIFQIPLRYLEQKSIQSKTFYHSYLKPSKNMHG